MQSVPDLYVQILEFLWIWSKDKGPGEAIYVLFGFTAAIGD